MQFFQTGGLEKCLKKKEWYLLEENKLRRENFLWIVIFWIWCGSSDEFKIFTNVNSEIVDPKNFKPTNFVTKNLNECIIPPNSFVLARTVEKFKIPNDVLVICLGKSTYARCGIIVNVTPLEPGWEGFVTLEFSNTTPLPAKIYANEGVQFIFKDVLQKLLMQIEMANIWVKLA